MPVFLVRTYPELTDFTQSEIKEILGTDILQHELFTCFLESTVDSIDISALKLALFGRCFSRVYWKLEEEKFSSKNDLYEITRQATNWPKLWPEKKKFAVIPETDGTISKQEIGKKAGQAIVDDFKDEHKKATVSLEKPDVKVLAKVKRGTFIVAIDLLGKTVNTKLEMLNRALLTFSGWKPDEGLGEVFHAGVSHLAYEYAKNVARRDKISGILLPNLKVVDKKGLLSFLRGNWEVTRSPQIICFEQRERRELNSDNLIKEGKVTLYSLSKLSKVEIPVFISNLVERKPDREGEETFLRKIVQKLASHKAFRSFTFLVREDVELPEKLRGSEFSTPKFRGIRTKMVKTSL